MRRLLAKLVALVVAALMLAFVLVNPALIGWALAGALVSVGVIAMIALRSSDSKLGLPLSGVLGLIVIIGTLGIVSVGNYTVGPPLQSQAVPFTAIATFGGEGARTLNVQTTVELTPDVIDVILTNTGTSLTGFKDLDGPARADAVVAVSQVMATQGFAADRDRGSLLTFVHVDDPELLPELGFPPWNRMYHHVVISVPTIIIRPLDDEVGLDESLVIEPNSKSAVVIRAPSDAFVNVSPGGEVERVGDTDERIVPLDQPGSIERTSVEGDLAHPWLAAAGWTWLVGLTQRSAIGALVALLTGIVLAVWKDKIKSIVEAIFTRATDADEPAD